MNPAAENGFKILPFRAHACNLNCAGRRGRRDRAFDKAAAKHTRLTVPGIIKDAGLTRRHAMFAVNQFDFVALRTLAA